MREKACFDFICYFNRTLKYTPLNIISLYTSKVSYMFTLLVLTVSNVTQKMAQIYQPKPYKPLRSLRHLKVIAIFFQTKSPV